MCGIASGCKCFFKTQRLYIVEQTCSYVWMIFSTIIDLICPVQKSATLNSLSQILGFDPEPHPLTSSTLHSDMNSLCQTTV